MSAPTEVEYWHARALTAEAEVERLNAWKSEAIVVLTEWDACYDVLAAAGRPARLGSSKARHVRAEVKRMSPVIEAADGYASQRIGWRQFVTAVANYRAAVAALDAGEQQ